jgi:hypothetical protein
VDNPARTSAMGEAAGKLVDGAGASRVREAMGSLGGI